MAKLLEAFHPTSVQLGYSFTIGFSEFPKNIMPLDMIWIPPGEFLIGPNEIRSDYPEKDKAFLVTLTDGFWLSRYPITHYQWHFIFMRGLSDNESEVNLPMVNINWYQAMTFCWEMKLSEFWTFEHLGIPNYRFTLPLEAQWEYACRAGEVAGLSVSNNETDLAEVAWYSQNSNGHLHPVGQKKPNVWGLYDMLGNVHEWCLDEFTDYPEQSIINWTGHSEDAVMPILRTIRGGSVVEHASRVQSTARGYMPPTGQSATLGFRLCLSNLDYDLGF
jgi:formylglycine-generating enzyme required for sulfatase activity